MTCFGLMVPKPDCESKFPIESETLMPKDSDSEYGRMDQKSKLLISSSTKGRVIITITSQNSCGVYSIRYI